MRPFSLLLAALSVILLASSPAARAKEGPPEDTAGIQVEKYQLRNGMNVILYENHDLPVVATNIWYHVGSREEPRGRSGFAHLFEHLMFMGTNRVPGSRFDQVMEAGGASNNASTGFDRTNYFASGPSNMLETLLWLEADRLEGLADAMTQEKLDLQREVVRNERRQSYDDAPYGPSELLVYELMYPHEHPYHFHVIGSHEDLQRATVEDVTAFFETFYVPNNATLVVAGDFDGEAVKPLIASLFGTLPRGEIPPRRSAPPASLERTRRVVLEDDVTLPKLTRVWHSPGFYAPGDAEMDLVASVLADGKNSRLVGRLVDEEQVAIDVTAYQSSMRLGSLFHVEVTLAPGADPDAVEAMVEEELQAFLRDGPTPRELERAVSGIETWHVSALQSIAAVADQLNQYDAYLGEPDRFDWDLERWRSATPDAVRAAARGVLATPGLVMWVMPEAANTADPTVRDRPPEVRAERAFRPPVPNVFRLENGLTVWHVEREAVPLVAARLLVPVGSTSVPADKAGAAAMLAAMLREGAGDRDGPAFADALDGLGATLVAQADQGHTTVDLQCLARHADTCFGLMADAVLRPRLDEDEWARLRSRAVAGLGQLVEQSAALARRVGTEAYFGAGDPFAIPVEGTPSSVATLEVGDLRAVHARYGPAGSVLLLAGALDGEQAAALARRHFGAWAVHGPGPALRPEPDHEGALRVLVVDRPGAAQTVVRFVLPGVGFAHEDRVAHWAFNTLFGGSFTSRLNANLREEHGYTYGARSGWAMWEDRGVFVASSQVETGVTGPAIHEFLLELRRLQSPSITTEELEKARSTLRSDTVQGFASLQGLIGSYAPYADPRGPKDPGALARDLAAIADLDLAALEAVAATVRLEGGVLVLVGDAEAIRAQWEKTGLPDELRVLDAETALLGGAR